MTPRLGRTRSVVPLLASLPVTAALSVALLVSPAFGQGLGDAAAREKAKRAKQGGTGPTFSNDDLERGKPKDAGKKKEAEQSQPATPPPLAESEAPRAEPAKPDRSHIDDLEARIQDVQDKLNPMSSNYVRGAFGSLDPNEEARLRSELTRLQAELARAQEEFAKTPPTTVPPERPPRPQ